MQPSDVLVVGGGPAGAWAAYRLARAGVHVTLFDPSHPREKPCGGGLTARALALVHDALAGRKLPSVAVDSLRFESSRDVIEMPLPLGAANSPPALVIADRRRFDQALIGAAVAAGAVHVCERVREVAASDSHVELTTASRHWRGSYLLGADGANSLIRRKVRGPFSRSQLSIAVGYYLHGRTETAIRVRSVSQPPGYIWSFPRCDHLSVGICAQADATNVQTLRAIVRDWIVGARLDAGARMEPYSWPIPSLTSRDFDREQPAGGRWMLLGDAAGLVDPLTREGIYYAIESANFAADAMLHASRPGAAYSAQVRATIYPELARAARLKARFFTSGFVDLLLSGLKRSASVRDVMGDLVAGRQPYGTLKRRLLETFELRLAVELLWLQFTGTFTSQRTPDERALARRA